MTKVHGKRYAYKFDFQGLAAATQPATSDPSSYKYQSELFMSSYHHSAKLGGFMSPHATIPSSAGKILQEYLYLNGRIECLEEYGRRMICFNIQASTVAFNRFLHCSLF